MRPTSSLTHDELSFGKRPSDQRRDDHKHPKFYGWPPLPLQAGPLPLKYETYTYTPLVEKRSTIPLEIKDKNLVKVARKDKVEPFQEEQNQVLQVSQGLWA